MMSEKIEDSVHVLLSVSFDRLRDENDAEEGVIVNAMTQVLSWLHSQIKISSLHTEESIQPSQDNTVSRELSVLQNLLQVFLQWYERQQKTEAMNLKMWLLWAEMGCTLDVIRCSNETISKDKSCALLLLTSRSPRDFSTLTRPNKKEKQVNFSRGLWDAIIAKPLNEASVEPFNDVASWFIEAFLHWMTAGMGGYETIFIANVASPLREHLNINSRNNLQLQNAWLLYSDIKREPANFTNMETRIAISVLVLSALTSTSRSLEVTAYLESLSATRVVELSRQSFSQTNASLALALGLSSLDDGRLDKNSKTLSFSGNATILSQFALLQIVNLPLAAPDMRSYDDAVLLEYQKEVHERVKALLREPSHAVLQDHSLRMTETSIEEMISFFRASRERHVSLIHAMESVLPAPLFRPKLLDQVHVPETSALDETSLLESAPDIVRFIKQFYLMVAPILEILSSVHLVPSFLALCHLEFAREVCAASAANASMQVVTQKVEKALEQTTETILRPMLRSLPTKTVNATFPHELDIISGCQALAMGIVIQRKLRILLFQCAPLIDDALALVFSMLYNVFEPADAFSHRFLGFCLSHLTHFIPLLTVFPYYLQVTLAAYPTTASPQELTKACGAIFGALFYSKALSMPAKSEDSMVVTTRRMVVWAIRKCCDRSTKLLAEDKDIIAPISTVSIETKAQVADESVRSSETDGLYLAGLVFELLKMAPVNILEALAMEIERFLAHWKENFSVLRLLKSALFAHISENCEAEKRAWVAAWYLEIDRLYPVETTRLKPSRL